MKYKLFKDSNPIMRKKSQPVELPLNKEDRETLDFMLDYLIKSQDEDYAKKHHIRGGVGIAAIQLGILKRMFAIYYKTADGQEVKYQLVNPRIVETSIKRCAIQGGEGCLSVDKDHPGLVHRYYKIKMEAYNALTDQNIVITASGYDAVVLQHEYDHLDGLFYYDRIDPNNINKPLPNEELL